VFDLAPLASDVVSLDPQMAIKALVASGALQYATTAIAMPFEVGKVLLQIQWVPKDHVGPAPDELIPDEKEEDAVRCQ
jgi:fusion and transport protein UGO1